MTRNDATSAEIPASMQDSMGLAFAAWTAPAGKAIEVAPRTWQVCAHVTNVSVIETDEGLVLVDCGLPKDGPELLALVRSVTSAPLHTVIYTHGHIDHAFGLSAFLEEAGENRPRIIAHENLVGRFQRYARTAPYNATANSRQSGGPGAGRPATWWPSQEDEFHWPDTTYRDSLTLEIGGETIVLNHAQGETDDGTWVWIPGRRLACVGDLWIDGFPNAGNPQKVQRYAEEWAWSARRIAEHDPAVVIPGHGMPLTHRAGIQERFTNMARYLELLTSYTIDALNAGLDHNAIVTGFEAPRELASLPYLQAVHDRPEFVIRNLIRRYGGWWNGRAADLMPPRTEDHAREVVKLGGGADAFVRRARDLVGEDLPLACQLAEWAVLGDPDSIDAHRCFIEVFERRLAGETAYQARGIYRTAMNASAERIKDLEG
ncbi:MBL fold metallo-hydrolase [Nocardioides sp. JQ2195]|uniref:alkyl sulfatase dimerization domain-containing protein n=1 Tax=Nocardioides sp. JQ2195 TaxID=2592334 RepID=UPI00143EE159|nr:alkyl sulfatase dimerization domain-containing protein [Nocardioides sp. JQ2195]QIX26499.1 MBL fold metallo-hydrolase [Nocardioides sp. JQ2195]